MYNECWVLKKIVYSQLAFEAFRTFGISFYIVLSPLPYLNILLLKYNCLLFIGHIELSLELFNTLMKSWINIILLYLWFYIILLRIHSAYAFMINEDYWRERQKHKCLYLLIIGYWSENKKIESYTSACLRN